MGAMNGRGNARTSAAAAAAPAPTRGTLATPSNLGASWPPLLVIHGGLDGVVASSNGQAAARAWAEAAGARKGVARRVQRGKRYAMDVTDFKRGRAIVATLIEVGPLGHAWSGGAAQLRFSNPNGPDASRMAWSFATKQFRLQESGPRLKTVRSKVPVVRKSSW